ncbi:Dynamin central region-domain-containing protein [Limtongia smithiae]|uniref:Dynamin central region-domain-containing protein n=1 Tax=Limtongia smithiae TaxID=1125753 RepID=UPI0034CD1E87
MSTMEDLIPVVNKLQDLVFNTIGTDTIDLPQVVVVGSQSCGKSSVLENIVGKDFLPRGTGIVTRRPLILQLINIPGANSGAHDEEWAEFLHVPGRKYYDFSEVRNEIDNDTSRVAGSNKGINKTPINLKIFSPHVLNLTLVDLPGLTKIPIGDQPTDIERQTRNLISEYITKPNSIILAVSPANVDLVNSESLKLARQVDPQGRRTIGVLTKLDLMDHGTNAIDILSGRVYHLKLGFIGVVNRSQQDIQANKSLQDSLKAEEDFFHTHPAYRNISYRCGTKYLTKSLNNTLMSHIRERLPDIKARLNTLMGQTQQELASYGEPQYNGSTNSGLLILQLMTKFATSFISSIDGTSSDISLKELCGGARIYYIYNDVFGTQLMAIDPTANLSVLDIRTAIRNSTGPRPSLFVPELAFDLLVKPQIRLLDPPSQRCVELVYEELMKICHTCGGPELSRYPKLQSKIIEVVSDLLRERLGPTSKYVESLILIQRAYINTKHPNFLGAAAAMSSILSSRQEKEKKARDAQRKLERMEVKKAVMGNTPNGVSEQDGSKTVEGESRTHHHHHHHSEQQQQQQQPISSQHRRTDLSHRTRSESTSSASGVTGIAVAAAVAATAAAAATAASAEPSSSTATSKDSFLYHFFLKEQHSTATTVAPKQNAAGAASSGDVSKHGSHGSVIGSGGAPGTATPGSEAGRHHHQSRTSDVSTDDLTREFDQLNFTANGMSSTSATGMLPAATQTAMDEHSLTEREQLETELIRRLISSYFGIVRETIQDQVPKAVMHLLVNFCKESIQNRLVSELYKEALFDELLQEDVALAQERQKCEKMLQTYTEAARIINEVV